MNKYQEALDIITMRFDDINSMDCYYLKPTTSIATLQELIDNQADYMSYQDLKADYKKEIARLNKALDKACEWITDNDGWVNIFGDEDWRSRFPNGIKTKEEWKEWLLNEEINTK